MARAGRIGGWAAATVVVAAAAWAAAWLGQRPARLRVDSSPPGGEVYVDGRYVGLAPVDVESLAWGPHQVSVERPGCAPWRRALDLRAESGGFLGRWRAALAGRAMALKADLAPLAECSLVVASHPPGAEVFIDGEPAGLAPLRRDGLTP
ncbi:MAG TPA: PEGA domain-containing protein, partial [Candidatus Brocadiia bacterium]|nr:PEGA domain-containing protein [Candidatus Brocadiia bacterium]